VTPTEEFAMPKELKPLSSRTPPVPTESHADIGWLMEMVAYDISVNLVFFGGADLDPPPPLGTTDRTRYVKIKSLDEAKDPELRSWIEQAGRVPGWR
jgi:hypothetical protein